MVKELDFEPKKAPKEYSDRKRRYDREYAKAKYHDDPETRERVKRQSKERSKAKRKAIQDRQNQLRGMKRNRIEATTPMTHPHNTEASEGA